jgi:hypothetical protein
VEWGRKSEQGLETRRGRFTGETQVILGSVASGQWFVVGDHCRLISILGAWSWELGGLWKACGIENRFQNSGEQMSGVGTDRESNLGFKWLNSNQLCNSREINMGGGREGCQFGRF